MSVSGSDNLLVMVWLRGLHTVDPFEAQLAERFPHLKVSDGTAFLHSRTRMGRLPDTTGRATGYTPSPCRRFVLVSRRSTRRRRRTVRRAVGRQAHPFRGFVVQ